MFGLFKKKEVELSPLVREAIAQMQIEEDWTYSRDAQHITNGRLTISNICDCKVFTRIHCWDELGEDDHEKKLLRSYSAPLFYKLRDAHKKRVRAEQLEFLARPDKGGRIDG